MSVESREKKTQIIEGLQETFSRCTVSILTDYRGLKNSEITDLRRKLQEAGIEYKVVKNTLARFAADRAGKSSLVDSLEGPVAIAFGYDDITTPAKVLTTYIRNSASILSIKGGLLGDRLLTPDDVTTLATLPPKEVLLARLMGQMKSPVSGLLNCLTSPLRGIMGVLQARIKQLEEN